jgi:hypothetical protein
MILLLVPNNSSANPLSDWQAEVEPFVLEQITEQGETTFWVLLREQADLSPAFQIKDWEARGQFVIEQLREVARDSQDGLHSMMSQHRASFRPLWIVNAIQVTGGRELLDELASRAEVSQILADQVFKIPEPIRAAEETLMEAEDIEWNISHIHAPEVWSNFGVRGEGIVVGSIDSGVQYDHPALVAQYRGNLGGGNFDHNYSWFDPYNECGDPSMGPCDNVYHGTHTVGIMVGDDGVLGSNQTGAAPGARWIAAKGCGVLFCDGYALLASAQWMLAPTDLNGENPRPDLRPHILNNSWGGEPGNEFFREIIQAWAASGIFPVFSVGNSGPDCGTAGSPGDYPESYGVGAFGSDNLIAEFSSRGPSAFDGITKPDLAAPGVQIRSSVPGNSYITLNGTSMAAPHVAGGVALLWSLAPALIGDLPATRAMLEQSAIDSADLSCGGTAGDNNVWGEGRLDVLAAAKLAPIGQAGWLRGTVKDAVTGMPVGSATIQATGPAERSTSTDATGQYRIFLPAGRYDLTVTAFGYVSDHRSGIEISGGKITASNFALQTLPVHALTGHLSDDRGKPISNATVTILGAPVPPTTSDASGFYRFSSVPEGTLDLRADVGRCNETQVQQLVVDGDEQLDFTLPRKVDAFGYFCEAASFNFVEADTILPLSGVDDAVEISLPFPFTFYGLTYSTIHVSIAGFINFSGPGEPKAYVNISLPNTGRPNGAIYPYWDDLWVLEDASIRVQELGEAPDRRFVMEWRNVAFCCPNENRIRFEAILFENGQILTQYTDIDNKDGFEQGYSATIGLENETGTIAYQYSSYESAITNNTAVLYSPPPSGFLEGQVTHAVDGLHVPWASVSAPEADRATTADAEGRYRLQLPVGLHTLEVSEDNYLPEQRTVEILLDQTHVQDFSLNAAQAKSIPADLKITAKQGKIATRNLKLRNTGLADLNFTTGELGALEGAGNPKPVLVFMDVLPWETDALLQVLAANGIPYEIATSAQMGAVEISPYPVAFIANDQPDAFYTAYRDHVGWFSEYVQAGGFLWFGASAFGMHLGNFDGGQLPGGVIFHGPIAEPLNDVLQPEHPTVQGMPDLFYGTAASGGIFENLPPGANIIAEGIGTRLPTLIEYELGYGQILALTQPVEHGWFYETDVGLILENSVPYAYAFETLDEISWLSESIQSGTIAPGKLQKIQIHVDTTGLEPGLYSARLLFKTNDPRIPRLEVPITLKVTD